MIFLITLFLPLIATTLSAQEEGELLKFGADLAFDIRISKDVSQASPEKAAYTSAASAATTGPVDRILFNGTFSDKKLQLQVSSQRQDGTWSDWQDVFIKVFPNGRFWARVDLSLPAFRIKYRLLDQGAAEGAHVEIFAIEAVNRKSAAIGVTAPTRDVETRLFAQVDTIAKPPVITREQWSAKPPIGSYVPHNPYRFAQHHTAGRRVATLAQGIAEQQFIQDFHQNGRGWQDIGYHFTVDDSGRIYAGVPPQFRGTHTGGNNTGNIGIAYFGNYQISGQVPTQAAIDALPKIWSYLAFEFGVNPDSLFGHRDYKATDCPGDNFYPRLTEMRNNIRKELGLGRPYAVNPLPQPFTQEIMPETPMQVTLKDDDGIDPASVQMRVNADTVAPTMRGSGSQLTLFYRPPVPFPSGQTVIVDVGAADLDVPPDTMNYRYQFTIRVEALHAEVNTVSSMRNAAIDIMGDWQTDFSDVNLPDLNDGQRLLATDDDSSHVARIVPSVPQIGDYRVLMASNSSFLGESAHYRFVSAEGLGQPVFAEYNTVFFRKWGVLSPTPVHFDTVAGQTGYIELSGLTDLQTKLVLDAFRLEKVDGLDLPAAPTMKWVRLVRGTQQEIEVAWYPTLEGDVVGYRLFASADGKTWDAPLEDETILTRDVTNHRLHVAGTDNKRYFKVVAVDSNKVEVENGPPEPLLSEQSDIYGVGLAQTGGSILVVDNFDRLASWSKRYHPFVRSHGEAIVSNGHGFDSCTETAVQTGEIQLSDYDVVFYLCGDDSRADESLAAADQVRLLRYLEGGGKLFISGSEIGFDFAATTATELNRYQNLLKAIYSGDLSGSNHILGVAGSLFDGLDFIYGTVNSEDTYLEDFPDFILPTGGSSSALIYDNLRIAAIEFTGKYPSSDETAQLIYLAFPFETIVAAEDRAAVMQRVLDYFGFPTSVDETPEASLPTRFDLQQNYPNPFNPTTLITYTLPQGQIKFTTRIEIFNSLGQKIRTLVDLKQAAGMYTVQWDGKNEHGVKVASGIYVYRLTSGELVKSRRMALLK